MDGGRGTTPERNVGRTVPMTRTQKVPMQMRGERRIAPTGPREDAEDTPPTLPPNAVGGRVGIERTTAGAAKGEHARIHRHLTTRATL